MSYSAAVAAITAGTEFEGKDVFNIKREARNANDFGRTMIGEALNTMERAEEQLLNALDRVAAKAAKEAEFIRSGMAPLGLGQKLVAEVVEYQAKYETAVAFANSAVKGLDYMTKNSVGA